MKGGYNEAMTQIYKTKNILKTNARRKILSILLIWISFIMILFLSDLNVIGMGFFLCSLFTMYAVRRYQILKIGIDGEEEALVLVSEVGDDYHVFSNLNVEYENRESETDLIVVGKKGVFVVEVKNHNGTIVGNESERMWEQHKVGRRGGNYMAELYNPTKQVGTHVWRLSKVLKEENIRTWVQGIVFFVNPEVKVDVNTINTPVLTLEDSFADYLNNLEVENELDEKLINDIVSFLKTKI